MPLRDIVRQIFERSPPHYRTDKVQELWLRNAIAARDQKIEKLEAEVRGLKKKTGGCAEFWTKETEV